MKRQIVRSRLLTFIARRKAGALRALVTTGVFKNMNQAIETAIDLLLRDEATINAKLAKIASRASKRAERDARIKNETLPSRDIPQ